MGYMVLSRHMIKYNEQHTLSGTGGATPLASLGESTINPLSACLWTLGGSRSTRRPGENMQAPHGKAPAEV